MADISKKMAANTRQSVRQGETVLTGLLDGTNTSEIITLSFVAEKVTFQVQGTGTLAGNVTFSLDGVNFKSSTAIAASNDLASFSTHNFRSMKITRTGGSGKLVLAAK